MTDPRTQFEDIKNVWMNALNQCRAEDLLLHFPTGKFGFYVDCDMTPLEGVMYFIESIKKSKLDLTPITISHLPENTTGLSV